MSPDPHKAKVVMSIQGLEESRIGVSTETLLRVEDLRLHFGTTKGVLRAVDGVNFELDKNHALVILGESGLARAPWRALSCAFYRATCRPIPAGSLLTIWTS